MAPRRDLIKGSSNSLLLCLLAEQPMYGYQIVKELEARSQGYVQMQGGHPLSGPLPPGKIGLNPGPVANTAQWTTTKVLSYHG